MPGILQRGRDVIKRHLDRRYAPRSETDATFASVVRAADASRTASAETEVRVDAVEARVSDVDDRLESLSRTIHELCDRTARLESTLASLVDTARRIEAAASAGAAFVDREDPHELRKRLYEAHRLAREGSFAIEQLLQQEVLIKRDLEATPRD